MKKHGGNFKDITGKTFGRITAMEYVGPDKYKRSIWSWSCSCGATKNIPAAPVMRGRTRSCGCIERESRVTSNTTHGKRHTPEYGVWCGMKARCYNPKSERYYRYGARGIKICDRWIDSFQNFIEDMGARPSAGHTIERIRNDQDYSPENCAWLPRAEQAANKSTNRIVVYQGEEVHVAKASAISGIPYKTLWNRINSGWDESRLFIPVRPQRRRQS